MPIDESKLENLDLGGFGINEGAEVVMSEAMKINPDAAARTKKLSKDSGIPEFAIKGAEDEVERNVIYNNIDFSEMSKRSPNTSKYLSDFNNASISHDDVDNLSALEKALTPLASAAQATLSLEEGLLRLPQFAEDAAALAAKTLEDTTGLPRFLDPLRGLETIASGYRMAADPLTERFRQARKSLPGIAKPFERVNVVNEEGQKAFDRALTGDFGKLFDVLTDPEAVSSYAANAVPSLLLAVASGGSLPAIMALEGGGELVEQAEFAAETGPIPLEKRTQATAQTALISGMLEKVGVDYLRRFPVFNKFFKEADAQNVNVSDIFKVAMAEMGTEVAQEFNQNLAAVLSYNPEKSLSEGILQAAVGGGLAGGGVATAGYYGSSQYKKAEAAAFDVKNSVNENDQQTLEILNHYATQSLTRGRDADSFKQFVKGIDSESQVYIEAEQVATYLQTKSEGDIEADPALRAMRDQLSKEGGLDAKVSITVADFATDVAGTEHYDALRQHMTLDPESPTPFRQEQAMEENQRYLDTVMEEAKKNTSQYVESQEIFTTVRDQLIDTGRVDAQQASAMAQIVPAYMAVKAKELNVPVAQVYEQFGLKIEGPQTGKTAELKAEGVLKQAVEFTPDTAAVVKAVDADGGITLNPDGSVFEADTGYVATLRSKNIEATDDLGDALNSFAAENAALLANDNVVIGVFDFGDGRKSIDINIVTQDREEAVRIGTELDQDSVWDIAASDVISTGGKGGVGLTLEEAQRFLNPPPTTNLGEIAVPVDENGNIRLTHHSKQPGLKVLDPSLHGTGFAGAESRRKAENPAAWVDRTYYGIEEGTDADYQVEPETGPVAYKVNVNPDKLYDFVGDPEGIKAESKDWGKFDLNTYEKNIKEAGYLGYWVNQPSIGLVVASFYSGVPGGEIQAPVFKQSTALRRRTETLKRFGLDPNKRHLTRNVAAALEARTRQKYGTISKTDRSPEASRKLAKWMVDEVMFELDAPGESGVGWYSSKFQNAMDTFAEDFPELKTDQDARNTLTLLIAITSDGQKVVPNFAQAIDIYSNYRKTGEFVTKRSHQRQASIDNNLKVIADMFSRMTPAEVHENLLREETISNLKKIAKEEGAEFSTAYQAHIKLPMAAIVLGPKLGAFYANLMGSHGYLTMDRWWTRTFNRYRGTLLQTLPGTADKPTDTKGRKIGVARFKEMIGQPDISDDQAIAETVQYAEAYAKRGYKNGTPIEKAANSLYKQAFINIEDAPYNATDRTFMLDTVNKAQKSLKRKGHSLTIADIQAILWYYEKRLYGELGAKQTADISYEEAAERVLESRRGPAGRSVQLDESEGLPVGTDVFNQPEQVDGTETRGYYDPSNTLIRLTESSNLSTFLHEFAHFMLDMEMTGNGAQMPAIKNWITRNIEDVAKEADDNAPNTTIISKHVRDYLNKGTSGDRELDAAVEVAIHEQFARGFETYLMEGKAPSMELRNVFRIFSRWLVQVYQSIRGDLRVSLDDEMREVFDRLIATEEQIEMAKGRAKFEPMFTDAAMAGMTEKQFEEYRKRADKVDDVAKETLRDQMVKQITRQHEKWWKVEKQDMVDEEKDRLKDEPVYKAITALKTDFKLDHAAVKEAYGEEKTNKLGRKSVVIPTALRGMTVKGGEGVTIADAAAFLGFDSGDQMIQEILAAPKLEDLADKNAEARMKEEHGDILTDGTIEQLADEALQNEEHGRLILSELKVLLRGTNQAALDRQTLKDMAGERIGKLSFREIQPAKYRNAEIKAAKESATALAEGNQSLAAEAKMRQAMNHYLAIAATDAKNNTLKIVDRTARYRKKTVRENIIKAGNDYMEQIDKILSRFEFRKSVSMKKVDKVNQSLADWSRERMEVDGDQLVLDPAVLDETFVTHWKNVAYDDLQGIGDSLKNLEHVARYSNKIKMAEEELEFQQLVDRWVNHMDEQPTRFKSQRTDVVRGKRWGRWAMAQMTKIPWMASWLDGGERAGMSHDILMNPLNNAYDEEVSLWREVGSVVMDAIKNRSKEDVKRHNQKIFIPEIKDETNDGNLMGHQVLAVALNTGNQSNLKKMLLGEGWANPEFEEEITFQNPKLQAVLKHMTAKDWELVQLIWDQMEVLYPKLAEVHRRTTGLTPPKIQATPVETDYGTFNGGYYPVKYDPSRSFKAELDVAKADAQTESMFGSGLSLQASVNASATSERTGYYAPIRLSLDVVQNHFQETIHYITHHDAVRQINKLIRNKQVAKTIKAKLGEEEYAQLRPWLNDVAKDGREMPVKMFWDAALQKLRFGTTLGIMGFKASTGLMQLLGLSNTAGEVGTANLMHAMRTVIGSPERMRDAWDFAVENSKVMNHRAQTMDREIRSAMTKLAGKRGLIAGVQETSMKHIALIQTYTVDLPTWHAAYIKGMKEWGDESRAFKYADWAVENVQGSGVQKDMARIMRGQSETGRMFTMFMTFFSSLWNMERDLVKGAGSGKYSTTSVAAKAMFFFVVPVIIEMWMRGEFEPDDEDDEDERLQKMLLNVALYPVQSVPFVRDVANGVMSGYGYNMSPIAQLVEGGVQAIPQLVKRGFTDEEITKGQVKSATKFIGAAIGIPGVNQAWATGEHLYKVIEDGEDLTTRELIYGPKR